MTNLLIVIGIASSCLLLADNPSNSAKAPAQASKQNQVDTFSLHLLNQAKEAQKKIQAKQPAIELQSIIDSKRTIEKLKLQGIAEMTKQQADLEAKKASPEALKQLEDRRKSLVTRFNELDRLITQIDKKQKTDLLLEKLTALITFLEPPAPETIEKEATQAPAKPLSRGAAPTKVTPEKQTPAKR